MLGLGGVTWIPTSVAAVTASETSSDVTPLKVALMWVAPVPAAKAKPLEPDALLMVATAEFEDDQVDACVRF
jgi:hypothetical protein